MDRGAQRAEKYFTVASFLAEFKKCDSRLKTLHSNLEKAVHVNIGGLYQCAGNEEKIEKVREGIEHGDFTLLTVYHRVDGTFSAS